MREAALNGLSDLDGVRARKPKQPAGKPGRSKVMTVGGRFRRFRSRATLVVASAGFSAIMVGIVCNAVLFQKGHHPAPLFGSAAAPLVASAPPPAPLPRLEAPPEVAAPPVEDAASAAPAPAATPVHRSAHAAMPRASGDKGDGIARLIGGGDRDGVPAHPKLVAGAAPRPAVARVRPGQTKLAGAKPAVTPLRTAALAPATKPKVRPGQTAVARAVPPAQPAARKIKPATALAVRDRPAAATTAN